MSDLITPTLLTVGTYAVTKMVDSLLERRQRGRAESRSDEATALEQVKAVWAELRQLKEDHEEEIRQLKADYATKLAAIKAAYAQRVTAVTLERDALLREIGPLRTEVEHLRRRVAELEKATSHG